MEVGEQAMYLARIKGMSVSEAKSALKEWFIRFGIKDWWHKKVEELSKGMAQKVQFITTVVHNPSLMILDEPFSGFDPVNANIIRKEILRLNAEGATIILSTHNMESVEELCENIALINKSKLVIAGGVDEIRRKYGNNNIEIVYTGDKPLVDADGIFKIISDKIGTDSRIAILTSCEGISSNDCIMAAMQQGVNINSFREIIPGMNDIFIKLVTEGN